MYGKIIVKLVGLAAATLLFATGSGSAQITVTEAEFKSALPLNVNTYIYTDTSTMTVDIGAKDGPNIYDFSNLRLFLSDSTPRQSIANDTLTASRYPSGSEMLVLNLGGGALEYYVFSFGNNEWWELGDLIVSGSNVSVTHSDTGEVVLKFPVTYNDLWQQTYNEVESTYVDGSLVFTDSYSTTVDHSIDAYGTLLLPGGVSLPCLRHLIIEQGIPPFYDLEFLTDSGVILIVEIIEAQDTGNVSIYSLSLVTSDLISFPCCVSPIRGDYNGDGTDADVVDLTFLVDLIFRGGIPSSCDDEADINADGTVADVVDLTFLIDTIFRGGPAPPACP